MKLKIEIPSKDIDSLIESRILGLAKGAKDKFQAVEWIKEMLNNQEIYLKVGCGGSHIWISNQKNERLAIIYF